MNSNYCDISIVLDRSGSMAVVRQDTIGGFNTFLCDQKAQPGKCTVTLVQFDDQYEPNYSGKPVGDAPELNEATYQPRGSTALLDAVGKTIVQTGERLAAMPESERPGKVIFVIITDGEENHSREFKKQQIKGMIEKQTNQWKWQFVYLGANVDAFAEAGSMGIATASAMNYTQNSMGTHALYASLSANTRNFRSGVTQDMAWNKADRDAQEESK